MIMLARILAVLAALFGIVLGLGFLIHPSEAGANFFLSPNGIPGLAVLRADMTAFFLTGGLLAAAGARSACGRPCRPRPESERASRDSFSSCSIV